MDPHHLSVLGVRTIFYLPNFFGINVSTACFIFVRVKPFEQCSLSGQQVNRAIFIFERPCRFQADVLQPLLPQRNCSTASAWCLDTLSSAAINPATRAGAV